MLCLWWVFNCNTWWQSIISLSWSWSGFTGIIMHSSFEYFFCLLFISFWLEIGLQARTRQTISTLVVGSWCRSLSIWNSWQAHNWDVIVVDYRILISRLNLWLRQGFFIYWVMHYFCWLFQARVRIYNRSLNFHLSVNWSFTVPCINWRLKYHGLLYLLLRHSNGWLLAVMLLRVKSWSQWLFFISTERRRVCTAGGYWLLV